MNCVCRTEHGNIGVVIHIHETKILVEFVK